jgi:hypothetical protein
MIQAGAVEILPLGTDDVARITSGYSTSSMRKPEWVGNGCVWW